MEVFHFPLNQYHFMCNRLQNLFNSKSYFNELTICRNCDSGLISISSYQYFIMIFLFSEVEPKGQTDKLSKDQVKDILCHSELSNITSPRLPKECSDCVSLWLQENEMEQMELEQGEAVRVKTSGNGPFISNYVFCDKKLNHLCI